MGLFHDVVDRSVAYFFPGLDSSATRRCGLHTMSRAVPAAMKDERKAAGIRTSGTTLHLKTASDLPVSLIEKVLRAPGGIGSRLAGPAKVLRSFASLHRNSRKHHTMVAY